MMVVSNYRNKSERRINYKKEKKDLEYHPYSKSDPLVRKALYEAYSKKCAYCGDLIQPKNMHVDHILATNAAEVCDIEFETYMDELRHDGFILDSIENYRPSCASCNLRKNNQNFSVSNMRFFHSEAIKKAPKVLSIINKFKTKPVSFDEFNPDYDYWERIDFSCQKDISEAIAGYRLQPCHVNACPRLKQVESIKNRLGIVDYVIVEGEPGCGKSITIYQAAFDLSLKGYYVFRYINKNAEETIFVPRSDENRYLIIIDDAQNLPQYLIDQVITQSQRQTKLILSFTKIEHDSHQYSEPIRITNLDAVKAIVLEYRKRKQEIMPIVQQFDRYVGDGMTDTPYERRINNAATKTTPWLFNYTLRGGWNTINEQFQAVFYHNRCGLLSAIIALLQIAKMDGAISFQWLQSYIQKFDNEIIWTDDDLEYLISEKLIASSYDVRIVHIESAKHVIHNFFKIADETSKKLLCRILEDSYVNHLFTEQGLNWVQSVLSSSAYCLEERVFTESMLDSVFSNFDSITDEERRGHTVYFLERVFHFHRKKNGRYYFKQYEHTIAQWISTATGKNAYAYSQLLNALNNERNDSLKCFVAQINIKSLLQNFDTSSVDDLYVWSRLFNRISQAYDIESYSELGKLLKEHLVSISHVVTVHNVGLFYDSITQIYFLNPDLAIGLLTDNINNYQNLWTSKPEEAIDIMGFEFLGYVCGVSFLSYHKPTKKQRAFSKTFVNALPVIPVAAYISQSLPRDWNSIFYLGCLLYRENKNRYAQIVKQIDIDAINNISQPLWYKTNDDLHLLFRFLALGDRKTAQIFLEANMDKIKELGVVFIEVFPEHAIKLYKKGVRLRLFENHWNSTSLDALKALHDFSVEDYCAMLSSEVLLFANRISEMCILDFEKHDNTLYDIILYIKNTCPDALVHIVQMLDFNKINKNKESMLKDTRFDKKSKKLFRNTIDLLLSCADGKCINELQAIKELK